MMGKIYTRFHETKTAQKLYRLWYTPIKGIIPRYVVTNCKENFFPQRLKHQKFIKDGFFKRIYR